MEIQEFEQIIRGSEKKYISSMFYYNRNKTKLTVNKSRTKAVIVKVDTCTKCKHNKLQALKIEFFEKEEELSIFQVSLLLMLFIDNVRPFDYAQYSRCQAGKEFIENIKLIEVLGK